MGSLSLPIVALVFGIVVLGGVVTGVNGFGYSVVGTGLLSGLVFGASNVGVQVVAYLKSLDLDHATFVGVVAMVFLGISSVRVVAAGVLGLYEDGSLLALSTVAAAPGLVGVWSENGCVQC
jgi:hypothetical protein